jgi:hypothetical protein
MPQFDIGIEGANLRANEIEAISGEMARDLFLKKLQEFLGLDSPIKAERIWFQPSQPSKNLKTEELS